MPVNVCVCKGGGGRRGKLRGEREMNERKRKGGGEAAKS